MEVAMRYRTQGSLPISAQHKSQYIQFIPRIPEEPEPISQGKDKEAPSVRGQIDEDQREQSRPKVPPPIAPKPAFRPPSQVPPTPRPEPSRFKKPTHDPCNAIIETSPYYVYFKICTETDAEHTQDEDLQSVLSECRVIDKDLPRTAKYRHFRSYEQ